MLIFDAHLDLAMNAMEWNRDYRQEVQDIRKREAAMKDKSDRGNGVVSFPELRRGNIGIVVATQLARYVAPDNPLPGWHSPEQAWAHTQGQLAWYRAMEEQGELTPITDLLSLNKHLEQWTNNPSDRKPIGYILSLEGADSIVDISYVQRAYDYDLRAIGPAHFGPGRYAYGTNSTGGIGEAGRALLREMERLNIILDVTHLSDESFQDALEVFGGNIWASHTNCRALVNHQRQFSDDQIRELIKRKAVIGTVLEATMLVPGFRAGETSPRSVNCSLVRLVDHIDHICQLAGNCDQVAIGSDLDGGFGKERMPYDLETIADLQKLPVLLSSRGYSDDAVQNIMHRNWIRFLQRAWS